MEGLLVTKVLPPAPRPAALFLTVVMHELLRA